MTRKPSLPIKRITLLNKLNEDHTHSYWYYIQVIANVLKFKHTYLYREINYSLVLLAWQSRDIIHVIDIIWFATKIIETPTYLTNTVCIICFVLNSLNY